MLQILGLSVGEYVKALECAKAYLLFHPDDEDVLDNVDYYESLLDDSMDPVFIEAREVRGSSLLLCAPGRIDKNITLLLKIPSNLVKALELNCFKLHSCQECIFLIHASFWKFVNMETLLCKCGYLC
jgi:hypothetical protein